MSTTREARNYGVATAQAQGGAMVPKDKTTALAVPPAPQPCELVAVPPTPPAELVVKLPALELVVVRPPPTSAPLPTPQPQPSPELSYLAPRMTVASMVNTQLWRLPPWLVGTVLLLATLGLGALAVAKLLGALG